MNQKTKTNQEVGSKQPNPYFGTTLWWLEHAKKKVEDPTNQGVKHNFHKESIPWWMNLNKLKKESIPWWMNLNKLK